MRVEKIDDIFQLDAYQLVVLAFNEFLIFTMLSNVVFNMFGVADPHIKGCDDILYNVTTPLMQCEAYDLDLECQKPIVHYEFKSITVEFEDYCSRHEASGLDFLSTFLGTRSRSKLSTTFQMIGIMVGSAIAGQISDLYGRKKTTLIFLCLMLVFSTLSSFSINLDIYVYARFFIGICCGGLTTAGCIFVVENLPSAHRLWMSTVITWAPNYMLFALFAYFTQEWRSLTRMCNLMTIMAILICALFSVSFVTYGLLFNYDVLTGSMYTNTAFSGFLRYIVGALVAVLDHFGGSHVGRKRMHFLTVTFIMFCMFATFGIYALNMVQEYKMLIRALTLFAFGTTGSLFLQLLLITAEMFPTGIRNIASAHVNVCGRLGNVFGPMVFSWKLGFAGSAYLVLALICLADVVVFHIFIPETKNQPLPQEMPSRKKRKGLMTIEEEEV